MCSGSAYRLGNTYLLKALLRAGSGQVHVIDAGNNQDDDGQNDEDTHLLGVATSFGVAIGYIGGMKVDIFQGLQRKFLPLPIFGNVFVQHRGHLFFNQTRVGIGIEQKIGLKTGIIPGQIPKHPTYRRKGTNDCGIQGGIEGKIFVHASHFKDQTIFNFDGLANWLHTGKIAFCHRFAQDNFIRTVQCRIRIASQKFQVENFQHRRICPKEIFLAKFLPIGIDHGFFAVVEFPHAHLCLNARDFIFHHGPDAIRNVRPGFFAVAIIHFCEGPVNPVELSMIAVKRQLLLYKHQQQQRYSYA